jgi:hypothetical protein
MEITIFLEALDAFFCGLDGIKATRRASEMSMVMKMAEHAQHEAISPIKA